MSAQSERKIRKVIRKNKRHMMNDAMVEIMSADFITRLKFCWLVIKGVKK